MFFENRSIPLFDDFRFLDRIFRIFDIKKVFSEVEEVSSIFEIIDGFVHFGVLVVLIEDTFELIFDARIGNNFALIFRQILHNNVKISLVHLCRDNAKIHHKKLCLF